MPDLDIGAEAGTGSGEGAEGVDTSSSGEWDYHMPSLGADMDVGTVLEWYVDIGRTVERGDLVALVSTEKADIDIEIWQPGTVTGFLVDVGESVAVGTAIMQLTDGDAAPVSAEPGERPAAAPPSEPTVEAPPTAAAPRPVPAPVPQARPPVAPAIEVRPGVASDRLLVSPFARRRADELGIDLLTVVGTGPGGAIVVRDVEAAGVTETPARPSAPPAAEAKPPAPREPVDRDAQMRRVIAERMARANRDIPHYFLEVDIDLRSALQALEQHNSHLDVADRVIPAAVLLHATAGALASVPELNGSWSEDGFRPSSSVDIGVAVSLRRGGLVTPTITGADERDVDDLMAMLKELVTGARRGALRSSWMVDASATVTNLGDNGADRVHGVVFPPQIALVGFGAVRERPWVSDGEVVVRPVVTASLSADHRATDGATGSRLLAAIRNRLENPEF